MAPFRGRTEKIMAVRQGRYAPQVTDDLLNKVLYDRPSLQGGKT